MSAQIGNTFRTAASEALGWGATIVLGAAFLLSAAGKAVAGAIDFKGDGVNKAGEPVNTSGKLAVGVSKAASAPWNSLMID